MRAENKNVSPKEILKIKERMQNKIFLKLPCSHGSKRIKDFFIFRNP
jgi:hypothetical protein